VANARVALNPVCRILVDQDVEAGVASVVRCA
jgi:hypothetical protein